MVRGGYRGEEPQRRAQDDLLGREKRDWTMEGEYEGGLTGKELNGSTSMRYLGVNIWADWGSSAQRLERDRKKSNQSIVFSNMKTRANYGPSKGGKGGKGLKKAFGDVHRMPCRSVPSGPKKWVRQRKVRKKNEWSCRDINAERSRGPRGGGIKKKKGKGGGNYVKRGT